ncbi:DoxX family protein [Flavobacteriaceae bacterium AH-315-B10]|nr:DoxX family protein [Flavobacteriaceae bacterium AH-315-B10]
MGIIKKLNKWANRHTYYPLDLLRIAFGVFLLFKGFSFIGNTQILIDLIKPLQNIAGSMMAIHYVTPAHVIGGLLIVFGLLTRWATLAQLPLIIGAVIINFVGDINTTNLILSIVALILCVFFTIYGSGKHSVDYYLKMQQ